MPCDYSAFSPPLPCAHGCAHSLTSLALRILRLLLYVHSLLTQLRKQKMARPFWETKQFLANENPTTGPNEKDLLVLSDYMTSEGEYLGGHPWLLIYDGPEREESECEQYYQVDSNGDLLVDGPTDGTNATKRFCAAWSLNEWSFDEHETGSCLCKTVAPVLDPSYCSSWECTQTEQDNSVTCATYRNSRSSYYSSYSSSSSSYYSGSSSCFRRVSPEVSEYACTEVAASGKHCRKWHGIETSHGEVEDERYVCLEGDPEENYCHRAVGETASREEAEMSEKTCVTPATNGLYCEKYKGTETCVARRVRAASPPRSFSSHRAHSHFPTAPCHLQRSLPLPESHGRVAHRDTCWHPARSLGGSLARRRGCYCGTTPQRHGLR